MSNKVALITGASSGIGNYAYMYVYIYIMIHINI